MRLNRSKIATSHSSLPAIAANHQDRPNPALPTLLKFPGEKWVLVKGYKLRYVHVAKQIIGGFQRAFYPAAFAPQI